MRKPTNLKGSLDSSKHGRITNATENCTLTTTRWSTGRTGNDVIQYSKYEPSAYGRFYQALRDAGKTDLTEDQLREETVQATFGMFLYMGKKC